jgi:hypothetical protein
MRLGPDFLHRQGRWPSLLLRPVQEEGDAGLKARRDPFEIIFSAKRGIDVFGAEQVESGGLNNDIP